MIHINQITALQRAQYMQPCTNTIFIKDAPDILNRGALAYHKKVCMGITRQVHRNRLCQKNYVFFGCNSADHTNNKTVIGDLFLGAIPRAVSRLESGNIDSRGNDRDWFMHPAAGDNVTDAFTGGNNLITQISIPCRQSYDEFFK